MESRPKKRISLVSISLLILLSLPMPLRGASHTVDQPEVRAHFKAKFKAGVKYELAIQAFKELRDYYNAKFNPQNSYGYIECTSEGNVLHIFTDYKTVNAYKRSLSRMGSDEEWQARLHHVLNLYCDADYRYSAYVSAESFQEEKPVADLSQGQDGKIIFTSPNLGSFREISSGKGQSKPVTISGMLRMPKGGSGKVPAVILLHGAGGVNDYYLEVADSLNDMGIAAFVVDSLNSRGIRSSQELLKELFYSYAIRICDAYAALELLSTHPKIDRKRIAVLGYSHGGKVALFLASESIRYSFFADDLRFSAFIAYYPNCITQLEGIDFGDAPVLMLLAEKDNICPIGPCLEYVERMKDSGADVRAVVYKGAHHRFPVLSGDKIINFRELPDWSRCGKEEYLFLREDGTWFFPHTNNTVDGVNPIDGSYTANCRKDGGAVVAGNAEAKMASTEEYQNLLRRMFDIK